MMIYEVKYMGKSNGLHHYEVVDTSDNDRLIGPWQHTNKATAKSMAAGCARGLARFDRYENQPGYVTYETRKAK